MTTDVSVRRRHLVAAAAVALVTGLSLLVVGWWIVDLHPDPSWSRFGDPSWWSGLGVRTLGFLMISKAGFKVALAVVLGGAFLVAMVRRRMNGTVDEAAANAGDARGTAG